MSAFVKKWGGGGGRGGYTPRNSNNTFRHQEIY